MKTLTETNYILHKNGFTINQLTQCFPLYKIYDDSNDRLQEQVLKFVATLQPMTSLLFCGNCGTGKDYLGRAYIREQVAHHGLDNFFCGTPQKLFREYRDTAFGEPSSRSEVLAFDEICNYDLLMLTDVGTRDYTPAERTLLIEIIDVFYEAGKPVIITTNCPPNDLKNVLDTRICDRLAEMIIQFDGMDFIPCIWKSYRRQGINGNDAELKKMLQILPPPFDPHKSFLACRICGKPDKDCNCYEGLSDMELIDFYNKNHYLVHTSLKPDEWLEHKAKMKKANELYEKLYFEFMKNIKSKA